MDATSAAPAPPQAQLTPKQKRRQRRQAAAEEPLPPRPAPSPAKSMLAAASKRTSALGKAAERLQGSRFRWLNEQLYSTTGAESKRLFDKDPSLAFAYHEGFAAQRKKWPRDPLDGVIKWLKAKAPAGAVIGDFGCGEARLALEVTGHTVHSFDLTAVNERVTPCNLANVPLPDASIDIAVFCLALMGTDWPSFLAEAHRCLRPGGLCHIVEVESRFSDVNAVVRRIEALGFRKVLFAPGNFFLELRFERSGASGASGANGASGGGKRGKKRKLSRNGAGPAAGSEDAGLLQGCIYRRR